MTEVDECPTVLDELAAAFAGLVPLGPWVEDAACGALGLAEVFTGPKPDPEEMAVAERVCRSCPARQDCAAHAAQEPVYGVWGGVWHDGKARPRQAA